MSECKSAEISPAVGRAARPLRIEVFARLADGRSVLLIYELPADCYRVMVDPARTRSPVYGFSPTNDPKRDRQVDGRLVWQGDGTGIA